MANIKFNDKYPKQKWIKMSSTVPFQDEIWKLINAAYSHIGGHPEFPTPEQTANTDLNFWVSIDVDEDPEQDATIGAKLNQPGGTKITVMGQDGGKDAKRASIQKVIELLKTRGFYAELDVDLANKFGLIPIMNTDIIDAVIKKDKIHKGLGVYKRKITGLGYKEKVLVGIPKIS